MTQWKVTKPPAHLIKPYEQKKTEFTSGLNKDILQRLEAVDKKNKPVEEVLELPDQTHLLKSKWQDWFNYIKKHPNLKQIEYQKLFGIESNGFKSFKQKCKKIGVNIEQYLGNKANLPILDL